MGMCRNCRTRKQTPATTEYFPSGRPLRSYRDGGRRGLVS